MKIAAAALAAASCVASATIHADGREELLKKSGCMACHAMDRKIVGPAFSAVAERYRGDPGAAAKLASKVKAGGAGEWGPVPMPPNSAVSDADARTLVAYVLGLKK